MRLRKWVQIVLLITTMALVVYGFYAFAKMENSIEIDMFHFIALILDIPIVFILTMILNSEYCTILHDLEYKLTR